MVVHLIDQHLETVTRQRPTRARAVFRGDGAWIYIPESPALWKSPLVRATSVSSERLPNPSA